MSCKPINTNTNDLRKLVNDFNKNKRNCNKLFHKKINNFKSFEDAIRFATLAIDENGRRFDHQRRFKNELLELGCKILLQNKKSLIVSNNFHQLISFIESLFTPVKGLGILYIYDTAQIIGTYLNIFPVYIYLHLGTREGARLLGLNYKQSYLRLEELPKEFQVLKPNEVEDFLCMYKSNFIKLKAC